MLLLLLPTFNLLQMVIKSIKSWITHNYCNLYAVFFLESTESHSHFFQSGLLVLNKVFTKEVLRTRLFCRYINKRGMYPIFNFHDENFVHPFCNYDIEFWNRFHHRLSFANTATAIVVTTANVK